MTETDPPPANAEWTTTPLPEGTLPFDHERVPTLASKWSAPLADDPPEGIWKSFDQIDIKCTMAMCEVGLHCFQLTKKMSRKMAPGTCRECGQVLVSLGRTAARDLNDVDATFAALQKECIRHYFWHVPFGRKALDYAVRAGRRELEEVRIDKRIRSRIGKEQPYADGRQTPISRDRADAIDFALHAVAACCRRCANYWHGIPFGRPLSDDEVGYLGELVRRYLRARLPWLAEEPQPVPRRTRQAAVHPITQESAANSDHAHHPHAS